MGIALLIYLVIFLTVPDIAIVVHRTNFSVLFLLFLFVPLLYLIRGYKWKLLLQEANVSVKFWQACKIVLMGTFYGMLTPAKAGELSRVYFLAEAKAKTLPTVLWDKLMDLLALAFLAVFSLLFYFVNPYLLSLVIIIMLGAVVLVFFMSNRSLFLFFIDAFSFPAETAKLYFDTVERISHKQVMMKIFAWSLVYYGLCILLSVGVLRAIDPKLPWTLSLALPFIILFGNAPLTIAGLGLRESASVFAFVWLGAPPSQGALFGFVLFLLITVFPGLIGFFLNMTLKYELIHLKNIPGNYYNKHTTKNPLVRVMMANFHTILESFFSKTNAKKVLDVGCGEGYTTSFIRSRHKDVSICGIDLEESIIALARQLHPGIVFKKGDIYKLDFPNKSFDVIIANEVLEHLDNPVSALQELRRVAKVYCIISVPNEPLFRLANLIRLKYIGDLGNTPGHVQNFTKKQFENLLKKHFASVEVKTSTLWNIALCRV